MAASTVLVGIDFSEPSGRALDEGRSLAAITSARMDVVHVAPADGGWSVGPEEGAWLTSHGVDPRTVVVRRGTPWVELSRHADKAEAEFIVVGSHGGGGYQPLSLGSTALRLTLAATRPVLVVGRRMPARASIPVAVEG